MAFALQDDTLLVPLRYVDLGLRVEQLLAPISLGFHLQFELTLATSSTSVHGIYGWRVKGLTSTSLFAGWNVWISNREHSTPQFLEEGELKHAQ